MSDKGPTVQPVSMDRLSTRRLTCCLVIMSVLQRWETITSAAHQTISLMFDLLFAFHHSSR